MRWPAVLIALCFAGCSPVTEIEPPPSVDTQDTRNAATDFLFVVDNSASMRDERHLLRDGFLSLAWTDPFRSDTRVAVTGTLVADPDDPSRPHPAVRGFGAVYEPGFGRLVDRESIERYRANVSLLAARKVPAQGCDDGWFAPTDVNADGVPCFDAHTQLTLATSGPEAGLLALEQLMQGSDTLFRSDADVHVVFVSDTHSPGLSGASHPDLWDLFDAQPTYADLLELAERRYAVGSLTVHAIAPLGRCGEKWEHFGPTYFDAAEDSGGVVGDVCELENYAPFIKGLVSSR